MSISTSRGKRLGVLLQLIHLSIAPALLATALLCGASLQAQSTAGAAPPLEYEVISVKLNHTGTAGAVGRSRPDGLSYTNFTMANLLLNAYPIRPELVTGAPGWFSTEHFDVEAKVAGTDVERFSKLTRAERMKMMQALLVERFKLKARIEVKELPVYDLVIAKGGPKLVEEKTPVRLEPGAKPQPGVHYSGSMSAGPGFLTATGTPLTVLTGELASELQRNVVDKTGLTGNYNIDLKWAREETVTANTDATGPSIFTALQEQLGLKLQPSKGPVDTLVIDHIELPSEN